MSAVPERPIGASRPQFAVVVPTHDRRALLEETVTSVLAQATMGDTELVVVDDASTDGTQEYLRTLSGDPRVIVLRNATGRERSASRNRGAEATAAPWIMFLDDDDLLAPGALQAMRGAAAAAGDDCVAVVGGVTFFGPGAPAAADWLRSAWRGDVMADCAVDPIVGPNRSFVRRSAWESVGGWAAADTPFEDWRFSLEVAALGPTLLVPAQLGRRRVHAHQSDLGGATAARRRIRLEIAGSLPPRAARRLTARSRTLDAMFAAHAGGPRLGPMMASMARDRAMWQTPLGRRSVAVPVLRTLLGAARRR